MADRSSDEIEERCRYYGERWRRRCDEDRMVCRLKGWLKDFWGRVGSVR